MQSYLGFSRKFDDTRYFEFNLLPFNLSSAPLIFTKTLKSLVTYWRVNGIMIAVLHITLIRSSKSLSPMVGNVVRYDSPLQYVIAYGTHEDEETTQYNFFSS